MEKPQNKKPLSGQTIEVPMEEIIIGDRIRQDLDETELEKLKTSIALNGLLQPILINQDRELIAGYRRYICCLELGHKRIRVHTIETKSGLHKRILEIRENIDRHDFSFSVKMKAAGKIEPAIQEESLKRKKTKTPSDYSEFGISTGKGATRDIIAEIVGLGSGVNYKKAKAIWESEDAEVIDLLDRGEIKINRALNLIKRKAAEEKRTGQQQAYSDQEKLANPQTKKIPLNKTAALDILNFLISQFQDCAIEQDDLKVLTDKIKELHNIAKNRSKHG